MRPLRRPDRYPFAAYNREVGKMLAPLLGLALALLAAWGLWHAAAWLWQALT